MQIDSTLQKLEVHVVAAVAVVLVSGICLCCCPRPFSAEDYGLSDVGYDAAVVKELRGCVARNTARIARARAAQPGRRFVSRLSEDRTEKQMTSKRQECQTAFRAGLRRGRPDGRACAIKSRRCPRIRGAVFKRVGVAATSVAATIWLMGAVWIWQVIA